VQHILYNNTVMRISWHAGNWHSRSLVKAMHDYSGIDGCTHFII
jgi:hypothetical protein